MGTAAFALAWLVVLGMLLNAGRLQLKSMAIYQMLIEKGRTPSWQPVRPRLYLGVRQLLLRQPVPAHADPLDDLDHEGWMLAVTSKLWILGAVGVAFVGIAVAKLLGAHLT